MRRRRHTWPLVLALVLATGCASTAPPTPATPAAPPLPTTTPAGSSTVVVQPPATPCCPHETLPEFLGIKGALQGLGKLVNCIRNELGSIFPGLEAMPPLLAIADPKNLTSSNPAVAAAAAAKADEDQAAQKIKAIRYLATLGCAGCYPDVEDALLTSLDDCTEAVRYEAAKALRELSGKSCSVCKTKSCCSPKVMKKLDEVANKMVKGCYKESSARVRREARLAMAGCGGTPPAQTGAPQEGPSEEPPGKPKAGATADADSGAGGAPSNAQTAASEAAGNNPAATAASVKAAVAALQQRTAAADDDCGCNQGQAAAIVIQRPNAPTLATAPQGTPTLARPTLASPTADAAPAANPNSAPTSAAPARISTAATHSVLRSSGAVMAEVNGQPVFEGEVLPEADRQVAELGPQLSVEEKLRRRPDFIRRELFRVIDRKLVLQEARRAGPEVTPVGFDAEGTDEAIIVDAWLKANVHVDETMTLDEMRACYQANLKRYEVPAEVRYEQLTARSDRFATREDALAAIEYLRGRAMGQPVPPMAVSSLRGVEVQAMSWTRREDVPSQQIAHALFSLPIGAVSAVFTEGDSWRVVRVLERHAAGPAPLELVAEVVRQQILRERREYLEQAYIQQLRTRARVWTVFDPPAPRAQLHAVRPIADSNQP